MDYDFNEVEIVLQLIIKLKYQVQLTIYILGG